MAAPTPIPDALFDDSEQLIDEIQPGDLVYFLCNVGDGDAQLIVLPQTDGPGGTRLRRLIIVDAGVTDKIPSLIDALVAAGIIDAPTAGPVAPIALIVATHPHKDHIAGIPQLLRRYQGQIAEFWDSGYYHTSSLYHETLTAIEDQPNLLYCQPTSGLRRWLGQVSITVLSPSIQLRNRFDTYGVEVNDASVSLRLEFPAARVVQHDDGTRSYQPSRSTQTLVLGGDAQTLSWSYVAADFPALAASDTPVARALRAATGSDLLRADLLKISHHGSKHGVNLELIERIRPWASLISSVGGGGQFNFPHTVAQELIREALDPSTTSGLDHPMDHQLGVFYTADTTIDHTTLGSIAAVIRPTKRTLWRLGDKPHDPPTLTHALRWAGP